eukprot:COSAG05_NODE_268_length_12518_cov_6.452774_7_plen_73_part_00
MIRVRFIRNSATKTTRKHLATSLVPDSSGDGGGADDTDDPWPPLEAMLAGGDNEPEPEPEQQQNVGLPCRQS